MAGQDPSRHTDDAPYRRDHSPAAVEPCAPCAPAGRCPQTATCHGQTLRDQVLAGDGTRFLGLRSCGHVQFATSTDSIPQIRGGQARALAVSSVARSTALPDVPTMAEYLPDYVFDSWGGLAGPKNIPADIVLNREINGGLGRPDIKAKYDDLGLRIHATSPADFGKLIAEDTERWAKVIKFAGIKPI